MNKEDQEQHPSYGMVSFSRAHGGGKVLFGSSLPQHSTYMTLRIKHATREHSLGHDSYFGKKLITEVQLSAAQFAELITTLNVGDGVPCTLKFYDGDRIEDVPDQKLEVQRVQEEFAQKMSNLGETLKTMVDKVDTTLSKKTLNNQDRDKIRRDMWALVREVESNLPYMLESFEEATAKTVQQAKTEVDSFVTQTVFKAGVEAIMNNSRAPELPPVDGIETWR